MDGRREDRKKRGMEGEREGRVGGCEEGIGEG